ncbi:MAG: MopE-related protein [Polyangiales bacterium]
MRTVRPLASLALLLVPSLAAAQVDPTRAFYAIAFTHGAPHNGVITAQSTASPFGVVATGPRGTANGAITFDPVRSVLYAGSCCTADQPLQAFDPVTLARAPTRDLTLPNSGSMAFEVDGPRRVLFFYDTVARTLRALSLADSNYGAVVATTTLTGLPAEPTPTSVGDQLAVDTRAQRVVLTGGDGGPVLTVDVSNVTATVGAFGDVVNTSHVNRATGNSGGAVAVDEAGRRIFFIPATGTVRVVNADAPFARIADVTIPSMSPNDCGLHFDARTGNLYVGRGSMVQPVVVAFPSMSVTPFATGAGDVVALSFATPTTACVDRDGDGAPSAACAAPGERADCDDGRAEVSPSAMETCNNRDDDCDGFVDEGFCRIDGACVAHDAPNPANACQRCDAPPTRSAPGAWSNRPAMSVCRPAAGVCDRAEVCDGTGAACPADVFEPATVDCRAAMGGCDVAERCTGMGAACPDDGFAPATQVCRASATIEACDPAERCTGTAAACPSDAVTRAPMTETCNGEDDDCDGMVDEPPCMPAPDAGPDVADGSGEFVPDVPRDVPADDPALDAMQPPPPDAMEAPDAAAPPPQDAAPPPPQDAAPVDAPPPADVPSPNDASPADAAADAGGGGTQDGGCGCATPGSTKRDGAWQLAALAAFALAARRRKGASRGR